MLRFWAMSARFAGCRVASAKTIPITAEIAAYANTSRNGRSSFCGRRLVSRIGTPVGIE
jgi:hypothetical protein